MDQRPVRFVLLGRDQHSASEDRAWVALRVGIDLVAVEEVEESLRAHPDRYLARVYTAREVDDCTGAANTAVAERLAARFAAKEAAIKVLRPTRETSVPWTAIEVVRTPSGAAELELSGRAAELAHDAGITSVSVSLTHERAYATAVVIAEVNR